MSNPVISRRQLFRGDLSGKCAPIRPPWAVADVDFIAVCDRCGDCLDACPEHIIRVGDGGYPLVDFASSGCSFCGECLAACKPRALRGDPERDSPWALAAYIDNECLAFRGVICRSCGEVCDESAIRFRLRVGGAAEPILFPDSCTGCGHCVRVCPVQAVTIQVPAQPKIAMAAQASP